MTEVQCWIAEGESFGYKGKELRDYVEERKKEKKESDREIRLEKRSIDKENAEREMESKRIELEAESKRLEAESKRLEAESKRLALEAEIEAKKIDANEADKNRAAEIELRKIELESRQIGARLDAEARVNENQSTHRDDTSSETHRTGFQSVKVPMFKEDKDDLDAWILRFERVCEAANVPQEHWALKMSQFLDGKALEVCERLSEEEAKNYQRLKTNLLKRFQLTEGGYRKRFKESKIEIGETSGQFVDRLGRYVDKWRQMAGYGESYEDLKKLFVRDQFFSTCPSDMKIFLKERGKLDLEEMTSSADDYTEAHRGDRRVMDKSRMGGANVFKPMEARGPPNQHPPQREGHGVGKFEKKKLECFICGLPHHTNSCSKYRSNGGTDKRGCFKCGELSHKAFQCNKNKSQPAYHAAAAQHSRRVDKGKETSDEDHHLQTRECHSIERPVSEKYSSGCVRPLAEEIGQDTESQGDYGQQFTTEGLVNGKIAKVNRDTGSNCCIVKASFVENEQYTGKWADCKVIDGRTCVCPTAIIHIQTGFYCGTREALVMPDPLTDLFIGNVKGADIRCHESEVKSGVVGIDLQKEEAIKCDHEMSGKQPSVTMECCAITRSQGEAKPLTSLKVGKLPNLAISPEEIARRQKDDASLTPYWRLIECGKGEIKGKTIGFVERRRLLFRTYKPPKGDETRLQLMVPKDLRDRVMSVAHCSLLSSHMGVKKTIEKVTSQFYWPSLHQDVRRYVLSCDICQRTVSKGSVRKVKLGSLPVVDTPFSKVSVDIIGPLEPMSSKGHRYILTMVDMCTRYPEAVALKRITAEDVAEAMFEIYCRMGIPKEVHSDRGSQFTSELMGEVDHLLQMRHTLSSPYHPMGNSAVERLNGTIKLLLKKMVVEKPKDWDRYLGPLLFALRDTVHASHGYTPFELMYGRSVRGPMHILKSLWTNEEQEPEVKETYQYVIDLREKIENTCNLAQIEIAKSQDKNKVYYNKKARDRKLEVGEEVLLLLPTSNNKLLLHWRGPFEVVEKIGENNYKLKMGNEKLKTFHVNMLKKYVRRREDSTADHVDGQVSHHAAAAVATVIEDSEFDGNDVSSVETLLLYNGRKGGTYEDVCINPDLSEERKWELKELVKEFSDIFSDIPGTTQLVEHEIKVTQDTPVRCKAYPTPYAMQKEIDEELQEMLDMGIIERTDSPYAAPLVVVKKADGSNRICCNYQNLNRITVFDPEPMMSADDVFQKLSGSKIYSKFDFCKGYWQIPMHENSKDKTAFICAKGLYRFKVMPFGLVNSASSYNRMIRKMLEGSKWLESYVDDVLAHTENWAEHLHALRDFFERVRKARLTLKPKKCHLGYEQMEFLGHTLNKDEISPKSESISRIIDMEKPKTKKQVRSFLGAINFYRKFIPKCAEIAQPLTEMTKKGASNVIKWDERLEKSFNELKSALGSAPILLLPRLNEEFILQTDASDNGIGAVLLQESEGVRHPVAYASKKLNDREKKYSVGEKECFAIWWGVNRFHRFLYGQKFILETDHCGLQYLRTMSPENPRVMRWSLSLQTYDYLVKYIKGETNVIADCLSRVGN